MKRNSRRRIGPSVVVAVAVAVALMDAVVIVVDRVILSNVIVELMQVLAWRGRH